MDSVQADRPAPSPLSKRVNRALASDDGHLRVWDVATGTLRFEKVVRNGVAPWSVVFAPDGQTIGMAAGDAVQFWDLDGNPRPPLEDREPLAGLAYAPRGQFDDT